MDAKLFYLTALRNGLYKELAWIIRAFTLTRVAKGTVLPDWHPYLEDGVWYVNQANGEEREPIEGIPADRPVMARKDAISIGPEDGIPGVTEVFNTNVGRVLFHYIVKVYPFGGKFPFENRRISPGRDMEPVIARLLTDVPEDPEAERDPKRFYVDELHRYGEATGGLLAGLSQVFTPSTTRKSLTTDPRVYALRDKLLADAAKRGKLNDPAEIAEIKAQLGKMDREWLKGDPAEDYLIGKKSFNIVRMKKLLIHGEEQGFSQGNQITVIPTSLSEGWNLENLPDYANSLREGSFNRGYLTMLGGEATSFLNRVFQNYAITETDCGSRRGLQRVIPLDNAAKFIGYHLIEGNRLVELTEQNIGQYAGKSVLMRSALFCKTGGSGTGYCGTCMGKTNALFPNSMGTSAADIGSTMLGFFMKKAHGTELKTVRFSAAADLH